MAVLPKEVLLKWIGKIKEEHKRSTEVALSYEEALAAAKVAL